MLFRDYEPAREEDESYDICFFFLQRARASGIVARESLCAHILFV